MLPLVEFPLVGFVSHLVEEKEVRDERFSKSDDALDCESLRGREEREEREERVV